MLLLTIQPTVYKNNTHAYLLRMTQFESWTKAVEVASRVKSSNRGGAQSSDPSSPSMQTLLDLVDNGEKSFKLLDVSKWMGMLQNKMAIFSSWKEQASGAISRCQDKYYISNAAADTTHRDVYVIIQDAQSSPSTGQKRVLLERISIAQAPDQSFSISSADLKVLNSLPCHF